MIAILYIILGYWATGRTIYANKTVIYTGVSFICWKLALGVMLGWILIPVALLKVLLGR